VKASGHKLDQVSEKARKILAQTPGRARSAAGVIEETTEGDSSQIGKARTQWCVSKRAGEKKEELRAGEIPRPGKGVLQRRN